MVYNLNKSLDYSRGAATRKTAPQTTNQSHNYTVKRVIYSYHHSNIIITSIIILINSFIINLITTTIINLITTKTTINYLTKEVIFRATIIVNSFIMIINSFIISFITSISYIIILIIIFNINITNH